jgi:fatty-acyl-CoA synthase/long-chain acyl-CoA synthetase
VNAGLGKCGGERLHRIVKEGSSPSRREIADFVGGRIAGYKKPRFIAFAKAIPRNASGKILKNELVAQETTPEQRA